MSTTTSSKRSRLGYSLREDEGEDFWLFGALVTINFSVRLPTPPPGTFCRRLPMGRPTWRCCYPSPRNGPTASSGRPGRPLNASEAR